MDPTGEVRKSCQRVTQEAISVSIHPERIESTVNEMIQSDLINHQQVDWDAEGWHYCLDAPNGPLTCQYIFVLDALNFCFWPTPQLEYDHLAKNLKRVLENNSTAFSASSLATITKETLASWFEGFNLPQIEERILRLQEIGEVLAADFGGLAENLVIQANGSAVKLVRLILGSFPGFRDTAIYRGRLVHFYKRAQILVGDLWAAYGRSNSASLSPERKAIYAFNDMDKLTMFADYRVPQILRQLGIISYSDSLREKIDSHEVIPFGSEEEIEIRACTVIAVEMIQQAFQNRGVSLFVIEIDWLLWQIGEKRKDEIPPHHRTLTIYY